MKSNSRALVVGVGNYPAGITRLPAVAADAQAVVKLLGSDRGAFDPARMTLLADTSATRDQVLATLRDTLAGASRDETVFIYFAGHGSVAPDGCYYFVPYNGNFDSLAATGVSLTEIRKLFEQSPCARLFMFLDFCHSGGILARGVAEPAAEDATTNVARTLEVLRGKGKVILCACTADQRAYENASHGRFTGKLLLGLQGEAANQNGEVTVSSLHDYLDEQMGSAAQTPMFYGQMEGRIVLMHSRTGRRGTGAGTGQAEPDIGALVVGNSGNLVMIDDKFFPAATVQQGAGGKIVVKIVSRGAEDDADISALKGGPWHHRGNLPYACRNDGMFVTVKDLEQESVDGKLTWAITLEPNPQQSMGLASEVSYSEAGKTYSADQIAELRARRLLLNAPPPRPAARGYNQSQDSGMLEVMIQGTGSPRKVNQCILRDLYPRFRDDPKNFLEVARLAAIFELKASNVFEHVLDLTLGPIADGKVHVRCRGRRRGVYSNQPAVTLAFEGDCPLEV